VDRVTLVSTFEGGFQPMSVAAAASHLLEADFQVSVLDTYIDGIRDAPLADADLVAIAMPLFDSLRPGTDIARKTRSVNPAAHITFFGQYATINASRLVGLHGDSAITGEWERPLVSLASQLSETSADARSPIAVPGLVQSGRADGVEPYFPRKHSPAPAVATRKNGANGSHGVGGTHFRVPARHLLPELTKYPQSHVTKLCGAPQIVGGTEISRGCHHKCTYCSVFAAYDGRAFIVPEEVVLEDVANLVRLGMTHLTFQDAEFINAKHHGLRIMRKLHALYPELTYDITTRIDHILENVDAIKEMGELGLKFITSALEFPTDRVLNAVLKEFGTDEIEAAIAVCRDSKVTLNPTFVLFNPWTSLEDLIGFDQFVTRNRLEDQIDPIQYETRLHLYKGSPLLSEPFIQSLGLVENEFHYEWSHPDPRVDELYQRSVTPAVEGTFKRCCLKC
jgi:radical SAM superfamily enzyme YgiQ (UPF0313 family)